MRRLIRIGLIRRQSNRITRRRRVETADDRDSTCINSAPGNHYLVRADRVICPGRDPNPAIIGIANDISRNRGS